MGNLCGKESKSAGPNDDHFSTPGRTLGAAPAPASGRAPVPSSKAGGPGTGAGRILGGSTTGGGGVEPRTDTGSGGRVGAAGEDVESGDPRMAAARAAEERAKRASGNTKGASSSGGGLSAKLAEQKKQTRTATLDQMSREERERRGADGGREVMNWD